MDDFNMSVPAPHFPMFQLWINATCLLILVRYSLLKHSLGKYKTTTIQLYVQYK